MDGLVLCLDGANYKSFKGEATTNILTNGNFSSGLTGWSSYNGATPTVQTATNIPIYQNTLKTVLNLVSSSTVSVGNYGGTSQGVSMTAGVTYTISYYARSLSGNMTLKFSFQNGAGDENNMSHSNIITSEWIRYTYTATLNTAKNIMFVWNSSTASAVFQITDLQIEAKSYATTFTTGTRGTTVATGGGWKDLIGSSNGELVNGVRESGDNRGSLVFDGTDDYVSSGALSGSFASFTVIIWFYPTSVTNHENPIDCNYSYNGSTGNIGPRLEMNSSGALGWIYSNDTANNNNFYSHLVVSSGLAANTWHFAAITYSGGISTTYYNGNVTGLSRSTIGSPTGFVGVMNNVTIGKGFHLGGAERIFTGRVSNTQIYNRALTAAEIKQNYNSSLPRFIGSTQDRPASSALQLVSLGITTNGYYYINLPTIGSTLVYCILDPAVDGGGWMVLWGAAQGATNYAYSFSASRDDISNSPINGFYSLSYAKRSAINSLCTENKTLVYAGSNSNWLRFDGYIWDSNSHTSGNFRFEFNTSLVTSNGTVDSSVEVGLTNYNVTTGGDFGIAINTNGLDHHSGSYYNLNNGCNSMYLYQYASGYKVNTGLSGWYGATATCISDNENDLPLLVAMK